MDKDMVQIKLSNGLFMVIQFSDNPAMVEDCDECIDYTVYSYDSYHGVIREIDGGNMDYNSEIEDYDNNIENAIDDVISFAFDNYAYFYEILSNDDEMEFE